MQRGKSPRHAGHAQGRRFRQHTPLKIDMVMLRGNSMLICTIGTEANAHYISVAEAGNSDYVPHARKTILKWCEFGAASQHMGVSFFRGPNNCGFCVVSL